MSDPSFLDNQSEADISSWRLYTFIAGGVISAAAFGYFFSVLNLVGAMVAGSLFLIVVVLQAFFVKSGALSAAIVLGESLAGILPFLTRPILYVVSAALGLFIFVWLGNSQGRRQRSNQIKIHFFQVERVVSAKTLTALAIFISIFYVSGINLDDPALLRGYIRSFMNPMTPIVQKIIDPSFSFEMTMKEFAGLISDEGIPPEQTLNALRAAYKIDFTNNEIVADVIYDYAADRIIKIPENVRAYTPLAAVVIVFLVIKSFAIFIQWALAPIIYLVYELLMALGFARVSLESRSREIIVL
ncbi:MAG TPA: hypothetical protein VJH70_02080 [Candidatus Paceibacterota bacterium]